MLIGAICAAAQQAPPVGNQTQAQEQALRSRVEEFYSLLQQGKRAKAAEYVTEDSKETFLDERGSPFSAFQIETVKPEPDKQSAYVTVRLQVLTPYASTPFPMAVTSRWRLAQGVWRIEIPKADPNALKSPFTSGVGMTSLPPHPEELKMKGHHYHLGAIQQGQIKTARFPFTNVTDHVVTVTDIETRCECLKAKLDKKVYKPGESGVLAVEFDSSQYPRDYIQTIVVETAPGDVKTNLDISAYVTPAELAKPAAESKPNKP